MPDEKTEAKLQPGVAFRLQPDGSWKPEKVPPEALKSAQFSGYLTIQGYRCTVFDTPDKNQFAQKSTGTSAEPEPTTASKIAEQFLQNHGAKPIEVQPMRSLITSRVASRIARLYILAQEALNIEEHPPDKYLGPSKYLIRVGKDAFVLVPFTENVIDDLKKLKSTDVMTGLQALDAVHGAMGGMDISAWIDGTGEDVKWVEGNAVNETFLRSMGIYNPKTLKPKATSISSRLAARWLQAQGDITSLVQKKLDRDGDDKEYDKAIVDFVTKTRTKLPPIDAALEKACDLLVKTREKVEHKHPKVQDRYVQKFLQELSQKQRELEDMRKQLMRGLTVELDRYEAEANPVVEMF